MHASFLQVMVFLMLGILAIILLTAKYRVHAFFALFLACFVVGLGIGMPVMDIIATSKDGFGNIMKSLGLIIVLGTCLGGLLEYNGSTKTMAAYILKITGQRRAALAMSITGFIVGLPIFCDSGFIVLSGLNKSIARRTGISVIITSISLATGLYAVHCLIPPHPGAAAAAVNIGVDFGKLIILGIIAAIPAMVVGHCWALYAGKNIVDITSVIETHEQNSLAMKSALQAFLPVVIPILLIAIRSFLSVENWGNAGLPKLFSMLGEPVIALSVGIVLALAGIRPWSASAIGKVLQESAEKAGGILVIIGAGGAFGAILAAAKIGSHFSNAIALGSMGMLFPFLLSFILKTAQGSSTVAIITAASIVQPLLPALGLDTANGKLLAVLSMGAGSMMISHANDAYFWVIAKFSGLDMKTMLKVYSVSTALMGIVTMIMLYLIALFL